MISTPVLTRHQLAGLRQCPRRLWRLLHVGEPAPTGPWRKRGADEAQRLRALAQRLAAGEAGAAVRVEHFDRDDSAAAVAAVERCRSSLLQDGELLLLDAPFVVPAIADRAGLALRIDIVQRDSAGVVSLIDVRASLRPPGPAAIDDAAMQAHALMQAGAPPPVVWLRRIDRAFVLESVADEVDVERYRGLLRDDDVSDAALELAAQLPQWLADAAAVAAGPEPAIDIGAHCQRPRLCGFFEHCSAAGQPQADAPVAAQAEQPIELLTGGRNLGRVTVPERERIAAAGWTDLRQLPPDFPADARARRVLAALRADRAWVDAALPPALQALPWPRWYFDFETIASAIPRWPGTRPLQNLAVQWSCHLEQADGTLRHTSFLDLSGDDPRLACAQALAELFAPLADDGPGCVLVWNADLERQQLGALLEHLRAEAPELWRTARPALQAALQAALRRIVDLLPIVRQHWYHPRLQGRYSLKAVLPALSALDYAALDEVRNGEDVQEAWFEAVDPATTAARRAQLQERMAAYSQLDTLAMVQIVRHLSAAEPWPAAATATATPAA